MPSTLPRGSERRQVTALFCDIVDYVALASSLDPEDTMHVVDVFLAGCEAIITQHSGYIVQYMGDGILAFFGYPNANEDDAVNAVRAGIALRDNAGALELPPGISLHVRVGIATGLVVVAEVAGRPQVGIVGETPNLAARLQSMAAPDSVVVVKDTQRITRGSVTYRDLGTFALKGYSAPVQIFEAVEVTADPSRFLARTQGQAAPLVGRERELDVLLRGWAAARAGQGQVIMLRGEAGIGKSRLIEELRRHAADLPRTEVIWYCAPDRTDSALYPIAQLLSREAGFSRGDTEAARAEKFAAFVAANEVREDLGQAVLADLLGVQLAAAPVLQAATPDKRKEVMRGILLGILNRRGAAGPLLLVLEDAHWCDATTLSVLDQAVNTAAERSWLVVVTARPEYAPAWESETSAVTLDLGRLNGGEAEEICRHLGSETLLPPAAVRQILARCDGIPLFVEEMTKAVIEAAGDGTDAMTIPISVQASLVARLDRLGPARRIANIGAVIGRRFSYEVLAALAFQPEPELRQALRALTISGLVERTGVPPASVYIFKHALIRDAAYESLFKRERQTLHGQIAAVLRDQFPNTRDIEPEVLAYHFTQSGASAEALPLWVAAGQRAAARAAHGEAVGHLRTALGLLRQQPQSAATVGMELQLLIGLAFSLAASQGYANTEVGKTLAEAQAICDALGDVPDVYGVLCGIALFRLVIADHDAAMTISRRAEAIAERTGLPEHRIQVDVTIGHIHFVQGKLLAARTYLENACKVYSAHDGRNLPLYSAHDGFVSAHASLLLTLHACGEDAAAEEIAAALRAHAELLGRPYEFSLALCFMAIYGVLRDDFGRARLWAEEAARICDEQGYAQWGAIASIMEARARGELGQAREAVIAARRNFIIQGDTGGAHFTSFYLGEIAALEMLAGDPAAALATVDQAIATSRGHGELYYLPHLYRRKAQILGGMPGRDPAEILAVLNEALAIANAQGAAGFAKAAALAKQHLESEAYI
jgi:class 3 adenylate cyclase/ATP/maltotriose-dependent transcriptional regulator MalT